MAGSRHPCSPAAFYQGPHVLNRIERAAVAWRQYQLKAMIFAEVPDLVGLVDTGLVQVQCDLASVYWQLS